MSHAGLAPARLRSVEKPHAAATTENNASTRGSNAVSGTPMLIMTNWTTWSENMPGPPPITVARGRTLAWDWGRHPG
eukprot:905931-Prorocentrum_minimum.AAC.2